MITLSHVASADILDFHGTFFIASIHADRIIVAIDSRSSGEKTNDRHCKIKPLSETALFFSTNFSYATDKNSNVVIDTRATAKDAFDQSPSKTTFDLISSDWANRMKTELDRLKMNAPLIKSNGFFAGKDATEKLIFLQKTLEYRSSSNVSIASDEVIPGVSTQLVWSGHDNIVQEFLPDKEELPELLANRLGACAAAVRDRSGDPSVGGEIAVATIELANGWRWLQRPEFCPTK